MTPALCDLPARDLARAVRSGETSAAAILESALQRIAAVEGRPPSVEP